VRRVVALVVGVAFAAGLSTSVLAQGPTTTPPKEEKKAQKPAEVRKPTARTANGTVKSSAADHLVVSGKAKGGKDVEWSFAVDPRTRIRKGGKDITAGDLAAGDAVHVRYHAEGGTNVAESVSVRAPRKAAGAPKAGAPAAPKKDEPKK
jgi:hypothetical protein